MSDSGEPRLAVVRRRTFPWWRPVAAAMFVSAVIVAPGPNWRAALLIAGLLAVISVSLVVLDGSGKR